MNNNLTINDLKTGQHVTHPHYSVMGEVLRVHKDKAEVRFGKVTAWFFKHAYAGRPVVDQLSFP